MAGGGNNQARRSFIRLLVDKPHGASRTESFATSIIVTDERTGQQRKIE